MKSWLHGDRGRQKEAVRHLALLVHGAFVALVRAMGMRLFREVSHFSHECEP